MPLVRQFAATQRQHLNRAWQAGAAWEFLQPCTLTLSPAQTGRRRRFAKLLARQKKLALPATAPKLNSKPAYAFPQFA